MITVGYTIFTPHGSQQRYRTISGTFMSVTAGDKGEPLLNIFTDEDEDECLAIFRVWDWATLDEATEDDGGEPAEVPEASNVISIMKGTAGGPAIVDEWTVSA